MNEVEEVEAGGGGGGGSEVEETEKTERRRDGEMERVHIKRKTRRKGNQVVGNGYPEEPRRSTDRNDRAEEGYICISTLGALVF